MYEKEIQENLATLAENPLDWIARSNIEILKTEQTLEIQSDAERAEKRRQIEQKWAN